MYINVASDDSRRYDGSCIVTCRQSYLVHILQFSISMFIVQRFRRLFFCGPRPFFATACEFFSAVCGLSFCGLSFCSLSFCSSVAIFLRSANYLRPRTFCGLRIIFPWLSDYLPAAGRLSAACRISFRCPREPFSWLLFFSNLSNFPDINSYKLLHTHCAIQTVK